MSKVQTIINDIGEDVLKDIVLIATEKLLKSRAIRRPYEEWYKDYDIRYNSTNKWRPEWTIWYKEIDAQILKYKIKKFLNNETE